MLGQRKDALESKVAELEKQLDRMVGEQTRESRDTGRKLSEAASGIRDNKIKEKIRYSKSLLGSGAPEQYARNFEEEIGANIDQLRKKIDEAASSAGQQGRDRSGDAVDKARELARGVDSLGRRMQERGQQNAKARPAGSAEGQQGQRGPARPAGQGRPAAVSKARAVKKVSRASKAKAASRARPERQRRIAGPRRPARPGRTARPGRPAGPGRSAGPGRPRRRRQHHGRLPRWRLGRRRSPRRWPLRLLLRARRHPPVPRRSAPLGAGRPGAAQHAARAERRSERVRRDHEAPARARFRARLPGCRRSWRGCRPSSPKA